MADGDGAVAGRAQQATARALALTQEGIGTAVNLPLKLALGTTLKALGLSRRVIFGLTGFALRQTVAAVQRRRAQRAEDQNRDPHFDSSTPGYPEPGMDTPFDLGVRHADARYPSPWAPQRPNIQLRQIISPRTSALPSQAAVAAAGNYRQSVDDLLAARQDLAQLKSKEQRSATLAIRGDLGAQLGALDADTRQKVFAYSEVLNAGPLAQESANASFARDHFVSSLGSAELKEYTTRGNLRASGAEVPAPLSPRVAALEAADAQVAAAREKLTAHKNLSDEFRDNPTARQLATEIAVLKSHRRADPQLDAAIQQAEVRRITAERNTRSAANRIPVGSFNSQTFDATQPQSIPFGLPGRPQASPQDVYLKNLQNLADSTQKNAQVSVSAKNARDAYKTTLDKVKALPPEQRQQVLRYAKIGGSVDLLDDMARAAVKHGRDEFFRTELSPNEEQQYAALTSEAGNKPPESVLTENVKRLRNLDTRVANANAHYDARKAERQRLKTVLPEEQQMLAADFAYREGNMDYWGKQEISWRNQVDFDTRQVASSRAEAAKWQRSAATSAPQSPQQPVVQSVGVTPNRQSPTAARGTTFAVPVRPGSVTTVNINVGPPQPQRPRGPVNTR